MARRKKPDGETADQAEMRRKLELVADTATRSEKVSWDRKMDNMVTLIAKLRPIEDKILDLMSEKTPIIDEISALRREMVKECVHPYHMLVDLGDGTTRCKFCDKKFGMVQDGSGKKT
jgi:hypothetical protein